MCCRRPRERHPCFRPAYPDRHLDCHDPPARTNGRCCFRYCHRPAHGKIHDDLHLSRLAFAGVYASIDPSGDFLAHRFGLSRAERAGAHGNTRRLRFSADGYPAASANGYPAASANTNSPASANGYPAASANGYPAASANTNSAAERHTFLDPYVGAANGHPYARADIHADGDHEPVRGERRGDRH